MSATHVELWAGWSLTLPNECQVTRNPNGSWSAWDAGHVVDVDIIELGGRRGGGDLSPEEMIGDVGGARRFEVDGASVWVSSDTETNDSPAGPQPIDWTRARAAATNTLLAMSIGNQGAADGPWHEAVWRSIRHVQPRRGLFGRR